MACVVLLERSKRYSFDIATLVLANLYHTGYIKPKSHYYMNFCVLQYHDQDKWGTFKSLLCGKKLEIQRSENIALTILLIKEKLRTEAKPKAFNYENVWRVWCPGVDGEQTIHRRNRCMEMEMQTEAQQGCGDGQR